MANWFFKLIGSITGNVAEVDANSQVLVRGAVDPNKAGLYGVSAVVDDGSITGTPKGFRVGATGAGRLLVGPTILLWDDTLNATTQNTSKYQFAATTQTIAQAAGLMTLNNGAGLAANTNCGIKTFRTFPLFAAHETRFTLTGMVSSGFPHVANNLIEFGLGSVDLTTRVAPTDGAFFRYNAANELRGVVSYNGVETQTAAIAQPSTGVLHDFMIVVQNDTVMFYIDRILRATITLLTDAPTTGQPFMAAAQAAYVRQYIGAAAPASATKFQVSDLYVALAGPTVSKLWPDAKAGMGHMAYQGQNGGTMGTSAQNGAANPAAAVPTNTTAALGTGLGGKFQETVSLAAGTEGIIASFQNPAPTVNLTGRNLVITGISISGVVTVVLAATAYTAVMSAAFGHTAVSLATAEGTSFGTSPTTKAPRKIALCSVGLLSAAAVGTVIPGMSIQLRSPIVVAPGEFFAITNNKISAAPATGAIMWAICVDAHYE